MTFRLLQKITFASLLFGTAVSSALADFSQFRGVGGSGMVRGQNIPLEWSAEKNLAWKVAIPGAGWSQPVIWKQMLFVTTAVSDKEMRPKDFAGGVRMPQSMGLGGLSGAPKVQIQWQVHCYNTNDGQLIWKQTVVEGRPEHPIHPSNTYATESPVVDDKGIYVFFGATGTMAGLSHDGSIMWKKELGAFPTNNGFGTGSSLAIHDGRVFAQHFTEKSASVTCVDTQSGTVVWSDNRDTFGSSWSSPIVWKNGVRTELISSGGERLTSYDPASGSKLWTIDKVKAPTACSIASDSDRIYFGGSDPISKGPLFAMHSGASGDLTPEKKNQSFRYCDWLENKAGPGMASPVSSGKLVVVMDNNILRAYEADTGKKVQERRLGMLKMVAASPLIVDNKVLILDEEGNSVLLEASAEFPLVGQGKIEDTFWATPAVANDSIYLRGIDGLYCIRNR